MVRKVAKIQSIATHKQALESFYYDGFDLYWKNCKSKNVVSGEICGTIKKRTGNKYYRVMTWLGVDCTVHRVIWFYVNGVWPLGEIDHIDGNSLNNAIQNLRDVTPSENQRNRRLGYNNRSGYIGVSYHSAEGYWQASIKIGDKRKHLGYFKCVEQAAAVRKAWEQVLGYDPNHGKEKPNANRA